MYKKEEFKINEGREAPNQHIMIFLSLIPKLQDPL